MASILTHHPTMVGLQSLRDINNSLKATNTILATGLRIPEASDVPAYWAIAPTTRSHKGALATIRDTLSFGGATFDVAYSGLKAVRADLQDLRSLLVAAKQPGVDRAALQVEISGILHDMENVAFTSVVNGENYLSVDSAAPGFNPNKSVVASFEGLASSASISTITLDITDVKLIDPAGGTAAGILDKDRSGTNGTVAAIMDLGGSTIASIDDTAPSQLALDDYIESVDAALSEVTMAASAVGASLDRISSQQAFMQDVMDANERAIGTLVDADMEREATKLRALQVQQQLAIQSLAVANASSANVLMLFR